MSFSGVAPDPLPNAFLIPMVNDLSLFGKKISFLLVIPIFLIAFQLGAGVAKLPVEVRSFKIIQNMVETGDYAIPRVNGNPFLSKPPLYYWMGALASKIRGKVTWATVRFPSLIGGIVALVITMVWGTVLGGYAAGIVSTLVTASTFQFVVVARRAAPDMLFSVLCLAALFLFEQMWRSRNRLLIPFFFIICALAFLTKAHAVLIVVALPISIALTMRRAWRYVFRWDVAGWLFAGGIISVSWYVLVYFLIPQDALYWLKLEAPQALGIEMVGHTGRHYRPLWYFLYRIWDISLPACVFIPFSAWHYWKGGFWRWKDNGWAFIVWSFIAVFVMFSLLPQKQPHYLVPVLPLLGLIVGGSLTDHLQNEAEAGPQDLFPSLIALAVILCGALIAEGYYTAFIQRFGSFSAIGGTLVSGIFLIFSIRYLSKGRVKAFFLASLCVIWGFYLVYCGSFEGWKSIDRREKRMGLERSS